MGQKFTVGHLTADMLNAIGQSVAGHTITSAGPTSGTTESVYATSQIFTPEPNTWYLAISTLNYITGATAILDGFWHRLRFNNTGGLELSVDRLDITANTAGPYSSLIGGAWNAGASPAATQIIGSLQRFTGDSVLTPDKTSVVIFQLGDTSQFTS